MEEKKLTDEKIVEAVDRCKTGDINDCILCPAREKGCESIMALVSDLIHRLQDDNKRLSLIAGMIDKGVAVEIVNMQETIDTQKAEIELLTDKKLQETLNKICDARKNQYANMKLEKIELISIEEHKKQLVKTRKDTAKDLLIDFNEWINSYYDAGWDDCCVCIPIDAVSKFLTHKAKELGVEVE